MEDAAGRRVDRARHLAAENLASAFAFQRGVGYRHCVEQCLGIGMQRIAVELMTISAEAGLEPLFQVGEPWWWVGADRRIALYDAAAVAAFGGSPVEIDDVGAALDDAQKALLDAAGVLLANATASVVAAARAVADPGSLCVVIGGSGNGEQIAANKVKGTRAALVWSDDTATLARQHNDANVLSMGARIVGTEIAKACVEAFLAGEFDGGRHAARVAKITALEAR